MATPVLRHLPQTPSAAAYQRLLEISVHLNSTRDVDDLLQYIIETAADVLGCEAASLLLFDSADHTLRFAAATGSDTEALARIPVPLEGSLAGRIFTQNRPLIEHDVASSQSHFGSVDEQARFRTRSLLGVPMRIAGQPTGVLEALNKHSGAFTAADAELLGVLASHAAIALRNARQMQSLEEALRQLQSFDALKSDFMALASHELRTPLATMLGVIDLLRDEADPALAPFVRDASAAGRRMHEIIDTMTQLEALRGEASGPPGRPVVMQDVLRAVEADLADLARTYQHRVTVALPEAPLVVQASHGDLTRLFTNLWKNALQFTPDGGRLEVSALASEHTVAVALRDSGIGIDAGNLERIFGEFYQVEDHLTRTHGGLGLGLTIAHKVAERHGGRLWAESGGLGCGTTLHVELPRLAS